MKTSPRSATWQLIAVAIAVAITPFAGAATINTTFSGTTLPTELQAGPATSPTGGSGSTYSVNNGLTLTTSTEGYNRSIVQTVGNDYSWSGASGAMTYQFQMSFFDSSAFDSSWLYLVGNNPNPSTLYPDLSNPNALGIVLRRFDYGFAVGFYTKSNAANTSLDAEPSLIIYDVDPYQQFGFSIDSTTNQVTLFAGVTSTSSLNGNSVFADPNLYNSNAQLYLQAMNAGDGLSQSFTYSSLQVVPEPSVVAMLVGAGVMFGLRRIRSKKAQDHVV